MRIFSGDEWQEVPMTPLQEWMYGKGVESVVGRDDATVLQMAANMGMAVPQNVMDAATPAGYVPEVAWKGYTKPEHLRAIQESAITLPGGQRVIPQSTWNQMLHAENEYSGGILENGPAQLFGALGGVVGAQALGFGGGISGGGGLENLIGGPGTDTLGAAGGNSLAEFQQLLTQQGVLGPGSGLEQIFTGLEAAGAGGLTGIGAQAAQAVASGGSALRSLSEATGIDEGILKMLGGLAQTGLGIGAGLQQSNATEGLGERVLGMGAPSLARYEESFAPGFNLWDKPGYKEALDTSWDVGLRKASAGAGNVIENPGVMGELNKYITGSLGLPALQNYREQNRAGGFSTIPQYAQLQSNAIGQQGGAWEAAGAGLENLLNPRQNFKFNLGQFGV